MLTFNFSIVKLNWRFLKNLSKVEVHSKFITNDCFHCHTLESDWMRISRKLILKELLNITGIQYHKLFYVPMGLFFIVGETGFNKFTDSFRHLYEGVSRGTHWWGKNHHEIMQQHPKTWVPAWKKKKGYQQKGTVVFVYFCCVILTQYDQALCLFWFIFCPLREENWVGDAYWRYGCLWQFIKTRQQWFAVLIDCSLKKVFSVAWDAVSIWTQWAVLQNWHHIPHLLPLLYQPRPCGIWNPLSFQPCSRSCHQPQVHFRKNTFFAHP